MEEGWVKTRTVLPENSRSLFRKESPLAEWRERGFLFMVIIRYPNHHYQPVSSIKPAERGFPHPPEQSGTHFMRRHEMPCVGEGIPGHSQAGKTN